MRIVLERGRGVAVPKLRGYVGYWYPFGQQGCGKRMPQVIENMARGVLSRDRHGPKDAFERLLDVSYFAVRK